MEVHDEGGKSNLGAQFIAPTSPRHPQDTREEHPCHTTEPPLASVYGRGTPRGYPAGGDPTTKPPITPVYGRDTPRGYPAHGYPCHTTEPPITSVYGRDTPCGYPARGYPARGDSARGYPAL